MTNNPRLSATIQKKSSRGRTPEGEPNPIDIHVGKRLRLRRELLGLSQEKLATLLGLTFQQIQKYEHGQNRIGASRLWDISKVLEVPIGFFYEEMSRETAGLSPRRLQATTETIQDDKLPLTDPMQTRETLELVKAFYKISNRKTAKQLFDLIVGMSKTT